MQNFVASEAHFQSTKAWIGECSGSHDSCRKSREEPLPSRVINVGLGDKSGNSARIFISRGQKAPYAALSYRWGRSNFILTSKNLQAYQRGLPMANLPQTILDAITCTQRLGITYLWVDALCILQDSEQDKAQEIGRMSAIYQNAHITISAAIAANSEEGFLHKREFASAIPGWQVPYLPFRCGEDNDGSDQIGTVGLLKFSRTAYRDPITTRAWTFQEHMLSRRLLVYGGLDFYRLCLQGPEEGAPRLDWDTTDDGEGDAAGRFGRGLLPETRRMLNANNPVAAAEQTGSRRGKEGRWEKVAEEYSRRALTFPRDRLPALSAIAEAFRLPPADYIAGCWRPWLARQLAWKCKEPADAKRLDGVGPSWSWTSLAGPIDFATDTMTSYTSGSMREEAPVEQVRIVVARATPRHKKAPYGEISGSKLVVNGRLVPCALGLGELMGRNPNKDTRAWHRWKEESFYPDCIAEVEALDDGDPIYVVPLLRSSKEGILCSLVVTGTASALHRIGVYYGVSVLKHGEDGDERADSSLSRRKRMRSLASKFTRVKPERGYQVLKLK